MLIFSAETNSAEISEHSGNHAIVQSGQKTYLYADLSKLFLTVTLYDLKETSRPINAGDWGNFSPKTKGELHDLDIELDFGNGKRYAMLRLSRGDMGLLEVSVFNVDLFFHENILLLIYSATTCAL